jgi:5'-deoxynucleotidase YfbR-like HD superfamily hydrolase
MSESAPDSKLRTALLAYFPMFIATLSLLTSIYNGYLNNKFVTIIQSNISRAEYMRTCKDVIDSYFQVKFRAALLNGAAARGEGVGSSTQQTDAANTVSHFAALATFLANLRDEQARVTYTSLSRELEKIVQTAGRVPSGELEKLFEPADRLFGQMNNDCVQSAKATM